MPTNCESVTPAKNLSPAQQCTTAHVARCSAMIATRKKATMSTTRNRRTSQQYHRTVTPTAERNSPQQRDDRPSRPLHRRPAAHHGRPAAPGPAKILDPFVRHWQDRAPAAMASTSGILRLRDRARMGRPGRTRPAVAAPPATAAHMHYPDAIFDAICTSPPTGTAWPITTRRATPAHATPTATCSAGR